MADARPRLRSGIEFIPLEESARAGQYLIKVDGDFRFQASENLCRLLALFDGTRDVDQVVQEAEGRLQLPVQREHVESLLDRFLRPNGLLLPEGGEGAPPAPGHPGPRPFVWSATLLPPRVTRPLTGLCQDLFHPALLLGFTAMAILVHVGLYWTFAIHEVAQQAVKSQAYLSIVGLLLLSLLLHELGHITACRYHGCAHGPIGIGLYLVFPVFYADVNDAWGLPRRARLAIDFGGIYFQLLMTSVLYGAFLTSPSPTYLAAIVLVDGIVLASLNPFFRYDGYWMVSDLLGIPNLRTRSVQALRGLWERARGRPWHVPPGLSRIRGARWAALLCYAVGSHAFFLGFAAWMLFLAGPDILWGYPGLLEGLFRGLARTLTTGDLTGVLYPLIPLIYSTAALVFLVALIRQWSPPLGSAIRWLWGSRYRAV